MLAFYVQVRYPHDLEWVTIDVCEDRRKASTLAADAFRHITNSEGKSAMQVRVIHGPDLVREGGQDAVNHAAADLWQQQRLWPPKGGRGDAPGEGQGAHRGGRGVSSPFLPLDRQLATPRAFARPPAARLVATGGTAAFACRGTGRRRGLVRPVSGRASGQPEGVLWPTERSPSGSAAQRDIAPPPAARPHPIRVIW